MLEIQSFKNQNIDNVFSSKIKQFSSLQKQFANDDNKPINSNEKAVLSFKEELGHRVDGKTFSVNEVKHTTTTTSALKKLKDASRDLEAFFIKMMFSEMKKNVLRTSFLKGGFAEEIFDDFLVDEYSKNASKTDSFGLSEQIYDQLKHYL